MKIFSLVVALSLVGCASAPAQLNSSAGVALVVPAGRIEVDNFATAKSVREADGIYFTGWFPIADRWVQLPFHDAIASKLKGSLKPDESNHTLQLAIIESGLFMDMKVSDTIAFVGMAAAFRERPYKCNLVLNIKSSRGSERREFEHVQMANRAFSDLEDKSGFISRCQDALVQKVGDHLIGKGSAGQN